MPKLTIKEIAKIAGVSTSAVSIVLNNKKGVSDETRKKVTQIVDNLQYAPNPNSRRLLFNKTNNIAVLFKRNISPLENLFYSELNRVIIREFDNYGYNLIFTSVAVENNNIIFPNIIKSYDVDGVIFYGDMDPLIINGIKKFDIPYLIVDTHSPTPDALCVYADYAQAAYTATSYLISIGHRRIAHIGNSMLSNYNLQTFSGYKKAIEEQKIEIPMNWIQINAQADAGDEQTAYNHMEKILSYSALPSAVFCSSDIYAIGAIKCIKYHKLKVPDDISIISIDDIILSSYVEPPLTTVRIDKVDMAKIAVSILVNKIEGKDTEITNHMVNSNNLIKRSSTKAVENFKSVSM